MLQQELQVAFPVVVWIAGLTGVALVSLAAIRRFLLPDRPVVAAAVATTIVGLAYVLSSITGVPAAPFALALAPAVAMTATADRPLSAQAWLRGAATLAVVLTILSVLLGESLITMIAGAATAGLLCFLLGRASAAGSTTPGN